MQNGFTCFQRTGVGNKDKQVSVVVRLKEKDEGIELYISRKDVTESGSSTITQRNEELELSGLSEQQLLSFVRLLEDWLRSSSYPLIDTELTGIEGTHVVMPSSRSGSNRGTRKLSESFDNVTISVSEREIDFGYWDMDDQTWKRFTIPAAETVDREVPQDKANVELFYSLLFDFFDVEYSDDVDHFEDVGPDREELSAVYRIEQIFNRFGEIVIPLQERRANREPLTMDDEADVQYLLHALLKLHFDDVRAEAHTD